MISYFCKFSIDFAFSLSLPHSLKKERPNDIKGNKFRERKSKTTLKELETLEKLRYNEDARADSGNGGDQVTASQNLESRFSARKRESGKSGKKADIGRETRTIDHSNRTKFLLK